jgi:hypothetical protein
MLNTLEIGKTHKGILWRNLNERDRSEEPRVKEKINFKVHV